MKSNLIADESLQPEKGSLAYVRKILADRANSFHGSVAWFRRRYFAATMVTIVLSAAVTVVAGLEGDWSKSVVAKNVVISLGAIGTVISAWGAFFSPRESWHLYAATLYRLRSLQARLDFQVACDRTLTREEIGKFFEEYQTIIEEHNARWLDLRNK